MNRFSLLIVAALAASASAQSSSLYKRNVKEEAPRAAAGGQVDRVSAAIASASFTAASLPEPRLFAVQDLVTIIVQESTSSDVSADIGTKKKTDIKGSVDAFPHLTLADLLNGQLRNSAISDPPKVDVGFDQDFKGEGDYKRRDTFVARLTARIVDVKPNGTLVLEARKFIQSDKETLEIVVTGTCRKDDVRVDNTVLSTQLYDLNLVKNHTGEVRRATKKGILTRVLETIFNF